MNPTQQPNPAEGEALCICGDPKSAHTGGHNHQFAPQTPPPADAATPETDAAQINIGSDCGNFSRWVVEPDFARTLELQRDEAREKLAHAATGYELTCKALQEHFGLSCLPMQTARFVCDAHAAVIAELAKVKAEALYWKGVVRGARSELHEAGRLSDEEYAAIATDTAARDYIAGLDDMRAELTDLRAKLAESQADVGRLRGALEHISHGTGFMSFDPNQRDFAMKAIKGAREALSAARKSPDAKEGQGE